MVFIISLDRPAKLFRSASTRGTGESAGKIIITNVLIEKYGIQEPEQPKKIVVTKSWNAGNQALVIQIITKEKSKGVTTFVITP